MKVHSDIIAIIKKKKNKLITLIEIIFIKVWTTI